MSDGLKDLMEGEQGNHSEYYDILLKLMDGNEDLDLKTEISKPTRFAALKIVADFIESNKLPMSAKILKSFIETLFRYNISHDRSSRREIIQALGSLIPKEAEGPEIIGGDKIRL